MSQRSLIFASILYAALSLVFGLLVFRDAHTLARQYHAQSFPKTDGKITSAKLTTTHGSKGAIYHHANFSYTYEVDALPYQSRRYRYDDYPTDLPSVNRLLHTHPPGSPVDVYYNPENPVDAVLSPLVVPVDISKLFLVTPVFFFLLWLLCKNLRDINWPGRTDPLAGGIKIFSRSLITRARLPRYLPSTLGLGATGIASLLAALIIQTTCAAAPVIAGLIALILVLAAGAAVFAWQFQKLASGTQDLVIDHDARTIQLPLTYKRRSQPPLPISEINAVTLRAIQHKTRSGTYYTYAPTLALRNGDTERLTDLKLSRAQSFATWLSETLGVPALDLDPNPPLKY